MPTRKNKEAEQTDLDLTGWAEAKTESENLTKLFSVRNAVLKQCEDAYFLLWKNKPTSTQVKATISPAPRVKVMGATRLLTATAPQWELPKDMNNPDAEQVSSKIEKFADMMWARSNSIQQLRVEEDYALSGFLYDEIQARIISTLDILESVKLAATEAEGDKDKYDADRWKNEIEFAQAVADRTPYLYESVNPQVGSYIKSRLGLEVYYTETEVLCADIIAQFGQHARNVLGNEKMYVAKTVCEWWDKTYHYVSVKGISRPIVAGKHGLKIIPAVVVLAEGSGLFTKPEQQSEPFLYTVLKSGLIERQNEMLTVLFTNMAALLNAQFVHEKGTDSAGPIDVSHNVIAGVVEVEPGGKFYPMTKNIFDPSIEKGLQLVDSLFDSATLYPQALGERLQGSDNFSLVSLLAQAGRLPLVPVQEALKTTFAALMDISFKWLKTEARTYTYSDLELRAGDIPDRLEFTVTVDVDLPQDKLQQASIADSLTKGPEPLTSKRWARVNILGEGQSDELQKEIWREQAAQMAFGIGGQQIVAGIIQMFAQMRGGPGGNAPPEGPPTETPPAEGPTAPPPTTLTPPTAPVEGPPGYAPNQ